MHRFTRTSPWSLAGLLPALLLAVALAACGQSPNLGLTLGSSAVEVLRGDTLSIPVTLTRSGGAAGEVTLSVSGLPADVVASFAPATLDGAADSSTLTLSVAPPAAEAVANLSVTATAAGLTATQSLSLSIRSLTVNGAVHSILGAPMASVVVSSQGQLTATDGAGSFTLTGLAVPYDVTVSSGADPSWAHRFEALTTPTPTLLPIGAVVMGPPLAGTATIAGNLSGGVVPVPANHELAVCLEGLSGVVLGCDALSTGDTSYSVSAILTTTATATQVRVHALEYEVDPVDLQPVAYIGYGTAEATLADGGAVTADVALDPLPAAVILHGDAAATGGGSITTLVGAVRLGPNLTMPLFQDTSGAASFAVPMPAVEGATYDAYADASSAGSTTRLAWTSGTDGDVGTIQIPAAVQLTAPADGATNVTMATEFAVANGSGGVITYLWQTVTTGPTVGLTTTRTVVTIPDTSAVGVVIPAGAGYNWQAIGTDDPDVNRAAAHGLGDFYNTLVMFIYGSGPGIAESGSMNISEARSLTTAP